MENDRRFRKRYHVLVVDDDEKLRGLLTSFIKDNDDYLVSCVKDADEALRVVSKISIDIMILDAMMRGMDGFDLVKELRSKNYNFPILMLSALDEVESKIKGLEAGADDYLAKPFSPDELLLRIKNILTRVYKRVETKSYNDSDKYIFGEEFEFDFSRNSLVKADKAISLSYSEGVLLSFLINHRDEVLTREQLAEALNLSESLRAVDVQITRLRKKIEINPKKPNFILTVRNKGYKFISF
jgi:two-component system phosphate regulon response regulator OmpR